MYVCIYITIYIYMYRFRGLGFRADRTNIVT